MGTHWYFSVIVNETTWKHIANSLILVNTFLLFIVVRTLTGNPSTRFLLTLETSLWNHSSSLVTDFDIAQAGKAFRHGKPVNAGAGEKRRLAKQLDMFICLFSGVNAHFDTSIIIVWYGFHRIGCCCASNIQDSIRLSE